MSGKGQSKEWDFNYMSDKTIISSKTIFPSQHQVFTNHVNFLFGMWITCQSVFHVYKYKGIQYNVL